MADLEDQVRQYCIECLDPLVGSNGFDIIEELATMLPMKVISMLLGIPEQDQVAVRNKTDDNLRTKPGQPMTIKEDEIASGAMFEEYIDWRAEHPSDDLMTQLLNAEFEDETGTSRTLTRQEVSTYTAVLAGAGNETTGRLIGWLTKVLAEHPDQRRAVHEDRSLIPKVIDETLRFEPTGHATARYVTEDIDYYGTTVPAGSAILLSMASANRDERRYTDPDVFDIHRARHPAPHLRLRPPLLPRRQPRPTRRTGRAGRDAEPVPRVGRRLRGDAPRPDLDGPRLGAHAGRPPLTTEP